MNEVAQYQACVSISNNDSFYFCYQPIRLPQEMPNPPCKCWFFCNLFCNHILSCFNRMQLFQVLKWNSITQSILKPAALVNTSVWPSIKGISMLLLIFYAIQNYKSILVHIVGLSNTVHDATVWFHDALLVFCPLTNKSNL